MRLHYRDFLEREPDQTGWDFRVSKLSARLPSTDADYNEMIRAFLVSAEYRARLGLQ